MLNRTTILIALLGIITIVLVVAALPKQNPQIPFVKKSVPTATPVEKTSTVYFAPSTLSVLPNTTVSVDVLVNTGKDAITGVQLELKYDPKLLTNVTLNAPQDSFFGTSQEHVVLFKEVNSQDGIITYAIAISPNKDSKMGSGKVATVTFRTKTFTSGVTSTALSFLDDTLVTREGVTESVLKNTSPLIITQQ